MKYIFYLILFILPATTFGQTSERPWYVPDHYKLQFAGNIGFLSAGAGYLHGHDKLETDFMVGYLPKSIGGDDIISITLKSTYSPWKIKTNSDYSIVPFSIGPYLSYSFGSQFDTLLPNEYPDGYYWWATSLRFGAYIGGRVTRDLPGNINHVALYYELGTYDLEALSYLQNMDYLSVSDIFTLALGVKIGL
ncbi:hypothetical protein [Fulvivirga sediminis]|uniref:Uncharacterized protein n=1 Tax=Fulvivirga sediminis TaxID=2803949 RepID=A0A937K081_9BACT|nr:hypothetical protein [Fulvivirga sediminis]MBL3655242.1 hypothetical protein [Fulvivirga sediminis]